MNVLLIDVGSTFVKYMIYNPSTGDEVLAGKVSFPDSSINDSNRYEVPVKAISDLIVDIFSFAAEKTCKSAYISVQMHGYLMRCGNNFSDYVSWRDRRGNIDDPRLKNIDFKKCGTSLKQNLPVVSLCTYNHNFDNTEFFTLGSYISFLLTGTNITHKTDACASGFFDPENGNRVTNLFGELKLPLVCDDIQPIGVYNEITIYPPMGDHQISYLGSLAAERSYLVNIGTATQISVLGQPSDCDFCEKRPYFDKKHRLITISGLTGGESLFKTGDTEGLCREILCAIEKLPARNELILGGGGSKIIFDTISVHLDKLNINCKLNNNIIGFEGLKMIANKSTVKTGTMMSEINFSNFPIILKNNGLDFFIIDNEHGAFDYSTMSALLLNSKLFEMSSIVRLSDNNRMNITKFSDMGAQGFLLPMTNNANDIRKVVEYAKYAPVGKRGVSTTRIHTLYDPPELKNYMEKANDKMKVYAQIETIAGVENISEILETQGVDGVFIGPNDLSVDLNCIGEIEPIAECIVKICSAAKLVGKSCGIITTNQKLLDVAVENGVDMISYGSEINMLISSTKKIKETILNLF